MDYNISVGGYVNFGAYGLQQCSLAVTIHYIGTITNSCTYSLTDTNNFGICLYKASDLTINGSEYVLTPANSEIPPVYGSLGNGFQPSSWYDYFEFQLQYSLYSVATTLYTTNSNLYADVNDYFLNPPSVSKPIYIGVNGKAREVTDMYVGVNGKARKVTAIYVGVNGKARKVFESS